MALSSEKAVNRNLSTAELREMLRQDFEMMLSRDGMLMSSMGFGRVSYDIMCKVYLDNPVFPEHMMQVQSKLNLSKPGIEAPPLANPSQDAAVSAKKLKRKIDNPNAERIRRDMPVPVMDRNPNTGRVEEHGVKYDRSRLEGSGEENGKVEITDMPENTGGNKWGLE